MRDDLLRFLNTARDLDAALRNAYIIVAMGRVCIRPVFAITDSAGYLRVLRLGALFRQAPGCEGAANGWFDRPHRGVARRW